MNTPRKAVLYARFSPRPNSQECDSVEKQIEEMRAYCQQKGYAIVDEKFDLAKSGDDEKRDGLGEALAALKKRYVLIVRDFSRLARDQHIQEAICLKIAAKGAHLVSITQGPADENDEQVLVRQILGAVNGYQLKQIRKRSSLGMRRNQANGRLMSKLVPFGYREGEPVMVDTPGGKRKRRTLIEEPEEQAIIAIIVDWHESGLGFSEICRRLTAQGVTFRGRSWHREKVRRIIRREADRVAMTC